MDKKIAQSLAAAAMLTATPALAQQEPVKVGIIDTRVEKIILDSKNVSIEHRSFLGDGVKEASWKAYMGMEHGDIVASSFVEQSKQIDKARPIAVYSATAFFHDQTKGVQDGNRPMLLDYKAAEKALDWFHEKGVRTVVTAFYSSDGPAMRQFIEKAKKLDIVLFAGTNNDRTRVVPFPARDPYAVAVTGSNANLDFANNLGMREWTAFQAAGDVPSNDMEPGAENGSSFAVARAAAFGAHYVLRDPSAKRDVIVAAMRDAGERNPTGVFDLKGKGVIKRLNVALAGVVPGVVHEDAVKVADAASTPRKPSVGMMAMRAAGSGFSR